jgi:hypothetical protein
MSTRPQGVHGLRRAQIVRQHPGAARGQRQRMLTAQPAARAGHDGHAALEVDAHDGVFLSFR